MKAEIISIGTELLLGHTINTDAAFTARELAALGIDLLWVSTVGDNRIRVRQTVTTALERSDVVITTGGLGPTGDDLTKESVAEAAGVPLELHEESLHRLEQHFAGRVMDDNQRKQAMLPQGCSVFVNNAGTAPGCGFRTASGRIVIMLPGPPSELMPMLKESAVPFLRSFSDGAAILSTMIRVFGMGEGRAAEHLADLTDGVNPTVATYASEGEMFVRVTAKAADEQAARALCAPVTAEIQRRLGDVIYGIDADNLESVVVKGLSLRKLRLATAESCTGGLLGKRLTDVAGASEVFASGVITYSNEAKTRLLGVPADLIRTHGAVSLPVARAMARGARLRDDADIGIGITGVAGPGGGTKEKPVGLVHIALDTANETWVRTLHPLFGLIDNRSRIRTRAASTALDMVRRLLAGLPPDGGKHVSEIP